MTSQPQSPHRILIAGIGNIFFGDDAFGSEVARRMAGRRWPDGVRVVDFGIRALDLVYALMDGYECTILIDAAPRGGEPGSLYVIEPQWHTSPLSELTLGGPNGAAYSANLLNAHSVHFEQAVQLAAAMGATLGKIILIGCEPAPLAADDDIPSGLSPPVQAAVDRAIVLIEDLLTGNSCLFAGASA